jgi:glycerophosphoryl diester phosphodiesterase
MGKWILGALALFLACVLVGNASSIWGRKGAPSLLAHRGLAQQFSREGLTNDTCTATRMTPPTHDYLENTLASMEAAFSLGAGMVELDIHPTTDGEFAVFHDWTLDCRTDGEGVTREQSMDYLRTLDIGHGYTADGGRTFPFRGRFKGAMPTLNEALDRFPNARFLVNLKSNDAGEADRLVAYLGARDLGRLSFYGAAAPIERMRALRADARLVSRRSIRRCLTDYLLIGWSGLAPSSCRNTIVFVPLNYRLILWGWPNLLVERMARVNTDVYVVAPWRKGAFSSSIDRPEDLAAFVDGYAGGVSTDRIDILGPALTRSSEGGATPPPP